MNNEAEIAQLKARLGIHNEWLEKLLTRIEDLEAHPHLGEPMRFEAEPKDPVFDAVERAEPDLVTIKARVMEVLKARDDIIKACLKSIPEDSGARPHMLKAQANHDTLTERIKACFE